MHMLVPVWCICIWISLSLVGHCLEVRSPVGEPLTTCGCLKMIIEVKWSQKFSSSVTLAISQVLRRRMWLVAVESNGADREHLHHRRKSYSTALFLGGMDQICIVTIFAWHLVATRRMEQSMFSGLELHFLKSHAFLGLPRLICTIFVNWWHHQSCSPLAPWGGQSESSQHHSRGWHIPGGIYPVVSSLYYEASIIPWRLT